MTVQLVLPFPWKQAEHLTITGTTGSGKTTLASHLITARRFTLAMRSKADPAPIPGRLIRRAVDFKAAGQDERYLLDPVYARQTREFWYAFDRAWKAGGWSVYVDELFYMSRIGLTGPIERFLTQGRSKGITMICGMQRPVGVTRYAMSESTHLIAFGAEGRDVKTLAEVGSRNWAATVEDLRRFEFAWFYRPERKVWRGTLAMLLPQVEPAKISGTNGQPGERNGKASDRT